MGVGLSTLSDNIGSVETDFLDDHDIKQEKLEKLSIKLEKRLEQMPSVKDGALILNNY